MTNLLLRVRHGHCALCEQPAKLYLLKGEPEEGLYVVPNPPNVHAGACLPCWRRLAERILSTRPDRAVA